MVKQTDSKNDLEKEDVKKVLTDLNVDPKTGLSMQEAKNRLGKYGPNAITAKEEPLWLKFLKNFTGPIAYMIEAAAIVSAIISHWVDFVIILILLLFNACIELWQDRKASNALSALKKGLAPTANVMRMENLPPFKQVSQFQVISSRFVWDKLCQLTCALSVVTMLLLAKLQSLPVTKKIGDEAYSGSIVKQGEMTGGVYRYWFTYLLW